MNLAMADATDLAEAIVGGGGEEAIETFERRMAARAAGAAADAAEGLRVSISPDGVAAALAHMLSVTGDVPARGA